MSKFTHFGHAPNTASPNRSVKSRNQNAAQSKTDTNAYGGGGAD